MAQAQIWLSPAQAASSPTGAVQFNASGGTGTGYAYSITANNSGASINVGTGAYTAGAIYPVTDVVKVVDSSGNAVSVNVMVAAGPKLSDIRTAARQRSDMVNSQFVTDAEFNGYVNASAYELLDLLEQKYGTNYQFGLPYQFGTDGQTDQYPLPPDFYKLMGVDLLLGSTPQYSLTIQPFQFSERNRWAWPNMQALYGLVNLRYRMVGNMLWLIPRAAAGQVIRLWYVPRMVPMVQDTDVLWQAISGWEEYVIVDAATKALVKEESDPSALMAQKSALVMRIEAAAEARDEGRPPVVSDTRSSDYEWPPGASGMGWGGG